MNYLYKCEMCKKELFENYNLGVCNGCIDKIEELLSLVMIKRDSHYVYKLFLYKEEIKALIRSFKFHNKRYLVELFVYFIEKILVLNNMSFDNISYVPMNNYKKFFRGYDQSELIAKTLAKKLDKRFVKVARRKKITRSLYKLNKEQRKKELQNAFEIVKRVDKILIIDDIFTTGITTKMLSLELLANNIVNFSFLTLV